MAWTFTGGGGHDTVGIVAMRLRHCRATRRAIRAPNQGSEKGFRFVNCNDISRKSIIDVGRVLGNKIGYQLAGIDFNGI